MQSSLLRGSTAKVNDDNDIDRTPEYKRFIDDLADFHRQRGTPFQPEPVVGHRKISLMKLYNRVVELGGYDWVTEEKGQWRKMTIPYKLPSSCTNGGFQLKTHYYKYLAAYEIEKHWGKTAPPPEQLEFLSAKGGGIMTRPDNWRHPDHFKDRGDSPASTPGPLSAARSLRQTITPRNFYSEESYQNRRRSPDRVSTPPLYPANSHPFPNMSMNQFSAMQRFQQNRQSNGGVTPGNRLGSMPFVNYTYTGGLTGPNIQHRIAMALRSGLHEEIDWALHELVRMSYELGDDIRLEGVLGLADALLDKISTIFKHIPSSTTKKRPPYLSFQPKDYDKVLEAMLILRNAALQDDNAIFLALKVPRTKTVVEKILALPCLEYPELMELRYYGLDVAESIIPYITISGEDDPLYMAMKSLLLSPERSSLILGLKALARMAVNDENNSLLQDISVDASIRVQQLLLLEDDEELVNAVLDFLYQFTTYKSNVQTLVAKSGGMRKLVDSLVRLMGYGGKEQKVTINVLKRMIPLEKLNAEPPALSQEILSGLLKLNEPERCIQWVRACYEEAPNEDITQVSVWQAYQNRFYPYSNPPMNKAILQPADMIKNVSVAYPSANAMVFDAPEGKRFTIRGVRPREYARGLDGIQGFGCKWALCGVVGKGTKGLWDHILESHLGVKRIEHPSTSTTATQSNGTQNGTSPSQATAQNAPIPAATQNGTTQTNGVNHAPAELNEIRNVPSEAMQIDPPRTTLSPVRAVPQVCRWKNCNRDFSSETLARFAAHIRTHIPTEDLKIFSAPKQDPYSKFEVTYRKTGTDERGEATGVPVTAGLVLRNLMRAEKRDRRGTDVGGEIVSMVEGRMVGGVIGVGVGSSQGGLGEVVMDLLRE